MTDAYPSTKSQQYYVQSTEDYTNKRHYEYADCLSHYNVFHIVQFALSTIAFKIYYIYSHFVLLTHVLWFH